MDDGISLRPFAVTQRLGPAGNPFAAFSKGAGHGIRSRREDLWQERPAKRPEDRIRYSKAFMDSVRTTYTDLPPNVQSYLPCFTSGESSSDMWSSTFQPFQPAPSPATMTAGAGGAGASAAPEGGEGPSDRRDWRTRPTAQPPAGAARVPAPTPTQQSLNSNTSLMHKASEAYRPNQVSLGDEEKGFKAIKGALNKLTPNSFDRLTAQIVGLVKSAEGLRRTISMVFEKAVKEPTFCALYASLCEVLSEELPDFPPLEGETKPMTFRRVLLNTCQDEFEGVGEARAKVDSVTDKVEKEAAEKIVKNRTLGNVRLIAELYKKGLVREKIMHNCIKDLLSTPKEDEIPHEDNLEAACEVITLSGKKMSETEKYKGNVNAYLLRLERFSKNKNMLSRIKFMIRDVLDMKANKWVPRREKYTAKKIDEIRQQAETELGVQIRLPQTRMARPAGVDDVDLFPTPQKFSGEGDWKAVTGRSNRITPPASGQASAAGSRASSPPQAERPKVPSKVLTIDERKKKAQSLFVEFISSNDKKEALTCARELVVPEFLEALVSIGVHLLIDNTKPREQSMIVDLVVDMCLERVVDAESFIKGVRITTDQLEDLSLDVPKSPDLCGLLLGSCIHKGILGIEALPALCEPIMGGEARRALSVAVFKTIVEKSSMDTLGKMCEKGGIRGSTFLEPKASWDPPELPSVESFLKSKGLGVVPV